MPDGEDEYLDHGWPAAPHERRPYLQQHGGALSHGQLAELTHGAPIENVELAGLTATQEGVYRAEVQAYVDDPERRFKKGTIAKSGADISMPVVVEWNGRSYIHDGHHRLFAAMIQGEAKAAARVVDAESISLARWAEGRADADEA